MKNKQLRELFKQLLENDLVSKVNTDQLIRNHPDYPIIENLVLTSSDEVLTEDHIDDLNDGNPVNLTFNIEGTYQRIDSRKNVMRPNNHFVFRINRLTIQLVDDHLEIVEISAFPSIN